MIWLAPAVFFAAGVFALYHAVQWSDSDWDRAGLRKPLRFLTIGLFGAVGAALYFFRALPRLEKVARSR